MYNANTGRLRFQSSPSLDPLDVIIESPDTRFELKGDTLRYETPCNDYAHLEGCLTAFLYVFPALLNVGFADPPVVLNTRGQIGQMTFRWEHREAKFLFRPRSPQEIEQHVADSFSRLELMQGTGNRRLAAALYYFYTASRLVVAGNSDWEFMAESVLNMCKSLEVIFGNSMDAVRKGLSKLGYSPEEIKGDFIPVMILRNQLDVGHPRVAILQQRQLQILYRYLSECEDRFRILFQRMLGRLTEGTFEIHQDEDLRLDPNEQERLDKLITVMESRIRLPKEGDGAQPSDMPTTEGREGTTPEGQKEDPNDRNNEVRGV